MFFAERLREEIREDCLGDIPAELILKKQLKLECVEELKVKYLSELCLSDKDKLIAVFESINVAFHTNNDDSVNITVCNSNSHHQTCFNFDENGKFINL